MQSHVSLEERNRTEENGQCDHGGRDWNQGAISQGMPGVTGAGKGKVWFLLSRIRS